MPFTTELLVTGCFNAEMRINAELAAHPNQIAADFLIARAILETGLKIGPPPSTTTPFGPLLLTPAEWDEFLNKGPQVGKEYYPGDEGLLWAQCLAAGWREHIDIADISTAIKAGGQADYGCDYMDLFLTYLVGAPSVVALKAAPAAAVLSSVLSAPQIAALSGRAAFAAVTGTTPAVDFLTLAETTLADALVKAFEAIKAYAPNAISTGYSGAAPWLAQAEAELAAGVSEVTHPARVREYFSATNYGPPVGNPPWCGAFVAFCMEKSGYGNSKPGDEAAAASWAEWGDIDLLAGDTNLPPGAIVLLSASEDTDHVSHVGFFSGYENGRLIILGGNQSDKVSKMPVRRGRVQRIRWWKAAPTA